LSRPIITKQFLSKLVRSMDLKYRIDFGARVQLFPPKKLRLFSIAATTFKVASSRE
jgi:hypothetical protein